MASWIDIHAHLNMLEQTPEEALQNAKAAGVERVVTIGTDPKDLPIVIELSKKFGPIVSCTLGIHPNDCSQYSPEVLQFIKDNLHLPFVVAVGEIGLDYYYGKETIEIQKQAFREQLQMAVEAQMPIEVHTRDAEEDTIAILKEIGKPLAGVIHCFTGTQFLADEALKLGLDISVSGVVTFKNAAALQAVVKTIPLDRLHLETDAPFLSPTPLRGKKNQPSHMVHTAEFVAKLKGVDLETLSVQVRKNALRTFPRLQWN